MNVTLRPATGADREFVENVYFATQRWILERLFGRRRDVVERGKFAAFYDPASVQIVCLERRRVGWLSTTRSSDAVEIGHIYLLPAVQGRGIGTQLIRSIVEEARSASLPVRLSTAKINPAIALYARLGFRKFDESEYKIFMELR